MSVYLIDTTHNYRADTEAEVNQIINKAKTEAPSMVIKYSSKYKELKKKGEVEDSWYKVSVTQTFNDEKEPNTYVNITYDTED